MGILHDAIKSVCLYRARIVFSLLICCCCCLEFKDRERENFRVLFGCLALFMCLVLVALDKCRKYMYKRNQ